MEGGRGLRTPFGGGFWHWLLRMRFHCSLLHGGVGRLAIWRFPCLASDIFTGSGAKVGERRTMAEIPPRYPHKIPLTHMIQRQLSITNIPKLKSTVALISIFSLSSTSYIHHDMINAVTVLPNFATRCEFPQQEHQDLKQPSKSTQTRRNN